MLVEKNYCDVEINMKKFEKKKKICNIDNNHIINEKYNKYLT